jgi:protoporphyrinogen oxidase
MKYTSPGRIKSPVDIFKHLRINAFSADIPLMNKYHLENSEKAQYLAQKNGIKLLGNTFTGVSVNDCIYHSALAAQNYSTSLDYRERFSNK